MATVSTTFGKIMKLSPKFPIETVFTRLLDMSPLNIPWYNHLVTLHVSIDLMTTEHGLENCAHMGKQTYT